MNVGNVPEAYVNVGYVALASVTDRGEVVAVTFPVASTARNEFVRPLPSARFEMVEVANVDVPVNVLSPDIDWLPVRATNVPVAYGNVTNVLEEYPNVGKVPEAYANVWNVLDA